MKRWVVLVLCLAIQLIPESSPLVWSAWGPWSDCDNQCGQGIRHRTRDCVVACFNGLREEIEICEDNSSCPVQGGWSSWSTWSPCTNLCGSGTQTRTRACDSPAPVQSPDCPGDASQTIGCNTQACVGPSVGCEANGLRYADNCNYVYTHPPLSWDDANNKCVGQGQSLLTLETEAEQNFIISKLQALPLSSMWLGGRNDRGMDDYRWTDNLLLVGSSWSFWKTVLPEPMGHQMYTDITDNGRWSVDDTETQQYACTKKLDCPLNYFRHGHACYHIGRSERHWGDAKSDCETIQGANLLYFDNTNEVNYIKNLIVTNRLSDLASSLLNISSFSLWTSGNDNASEGTWVWSLGDVSRPISFENFAPGQPNGGSASNCLSLDADVNYSWVDSSCSETKMYMCKIRASVCGPPPKVANAIRIPDRPNASYVNNTLLKFRCFPGYYFMDNSQEKSITCLHNLAWSDYQPGNCTAACPGLDITRATPSPSVGGPYVAGTSLNFTCALGYFFKQYLSVSIQMRCMEDGMWDIGVIPGECEPITCQGPHTIYAYLEDTLSTFRSPTDPNAFNSSSIVRLKCRARYLFPDTLTDSKLISCQEDGTWNISTSLFECVLTFCEEPPWIPNAITVYNDTELNYGINETYLHLYAPGESAFYYCEGGYHFDHSNFLNHSALCQNGTWTTPNHHILCAEDRCEDTPLLPYANITYMSAYPSLHENVSSYALNTVLVYRCEDGLYFKSNSTLSTTINVTCDIGGYWRVTEEMETCMPIMCPEPPLINLSMMYVTGNSSSVYTWNTTVEYMCASGFHFASNSHLASITIVCDKNGTWNTDVQDACVAMQCPPPPVVWNTRTDVISGYGVVILANNTFLANETWSSNTTDDHNTTFGDMTYYVDTSVVYNCLPNHYFSNETLQQTAIIICLENGTWTPLLNPEYCQKLSRNHSRNSSESTTTSFNLTTVNPSNMSYTDTNASNFSVAHQNVSLSTSIFTVGPEMTTSGLHFTDSVNNINASTSLEANMTSPANDIKNVKSPANDVSTSSTPTISATQPDASIQTTESVITHCAFFQNVTNAEADKVNTSVGAVIVYTCVNGTTFPAGGTNRTTRCTEKGKWSSLVSACSEIVVRVVKRARRLPPLEAPGAPIFGSFGLAILLAIVLTIIISDLATLQMQLRMMRRNVNSYFSFKSRKLIVKEKTEGGRHKLADKEKRAPDSSRQCLVSIDGSSSAHGHVHPSTSKDPRFYHI
ncbi:sushi, von Willebrand factor type A, EGF and pentraxin domain-containing protein 1 [Lingula anatina]|uniref:Sushi, von Willebrand factor type A, EGF and pentraxin domain-containing protein 1 n=1 Tax=Lingula anatina TaxID=7574 RepID=A0A1S3J6L5_LINAN|nr:sushi, von Willebrand factor type A, EGF and pentraxin domain-containing protein 1 [Lingula anatina]|eukprot:XP_013406057.1 sushi, von Willebrand factor type A, EGF and pentraxin domain-containing protein 1 [Lingula anatina]